MNRRTMPVTAAAAALALVTTAATWSTHAWINPDLHGRSDAELRQEARTLFDRSRTEPWYTAWAPALRHERVSRELQHRGVRWFERRHATPHAQPEQPDRASGYPSSDAPSTTVWPASKRITRRRPR